MSTRASKPEQQKTWVFYTLNDFIHTKVTGGTKRFRELIYDLLEMGDTVHLYIPEPNGFEDRRNLHKHPLKRKASRWFPDSLLNFVLNYRRLKAIRHLDYDKAVLVSVPYGFQAAWLGIHKTALIIWEDFVAYRLLQHSRPFVKLFGSFLVPVLTWFERKALVHAETIITQCAYDKRVLMERHPAFAQTIEAKTRVLPNNVDPSWVKENEKYIRPSEKNYAAPFELVFIGNIDNERKGLHILLGAAEKLIKAGYTFTLEVIGDGKLLKDYRAGYAAYPQIRFLGKQENPMETLASKDLLVVPSLADSFPNTVMEGLFLEIPVLGSRRGGIPEMLRFEELLFEPGEESLFTKLQAILKEEEMKKLAELGKKRKEALSFDWSGEMRRRLS